MDTRSRWERFKWDTLPLFTIFAAIGLIGFGAYSFSTWMDRKTPEQLQEQQARHDAFLLLRGHNIVSDLKFFKHGPDGPCFAVGQPNGYGAFAFTCLPCDQVPAGRLEHLNVVP